MSQKLGPYNIPEVNYTLNDVKSIINKYQSIDTKDFTSRAINNLGRDDIKTIPYRVTPHFEGEYFVGYDYFINDIRYTSRLNAPIVKSKKLSIEGYDIDLFIKNQLEVVYRDYRGILQEYSYYFGIPNPVYFLPNIDPSINKVTYKHDIGDEDLGNGEIICQYERGSDGTMYRNGLAYTFSGNKIVTLEYSWGILRSIIATFNDNNRLLFSASFDQYGYAMEAFFRPERGLTIETISYLYSFQGPSLNGPVWCYHGDPDYFLTSFKDGVYQQFYTSSNRRNATIMDPNRDIIRGTISPFTQYPIPILWGIEFQDALAFPYNNVNNYASMDIFAGAGLVNYRLPNDNLEGPGLYVEEKKINGVEWYLDVNFRTPESYVKDFDYIDSVVRLILIPPIAKIVRDYIYGDRYPVYLKMLLNEFGDQLSKEELDGIKTILSRY
ncbi:MAG: hypothetical protein Solumvirus2_65 [Solumvirus sp.]|uniref:Uncharacterized protein n=1 Tax=Solumvirus sp. TaxID=2487773 RepID=A0A3G5AGJ7_9VIRU|nr:MAG: hypothetical protein Solumvirus2_65 [Solumvirus sp.]